MNRPRSCALGGAVLVLVTSAAAHADPEPTRASGAKWVVETKGTACEAHRAELEQEVSLACAAFESSCRVVPTPAEAELRATVDCESSPERWSLDTRTIEGARLAHVDLEGTDSDRLRQAAMEIARDAAPEHLLAIEALKNSLGQGDKPQVFDPEKGKIGLAVAARGAVTNNATSMGGGRALVGLRFSPVFALTFGVGGELGGSGLDARRHGRGGIGIVVGAPFTSRTTGAASILGFGLEVGPDVGQYYQRTNVLPFETRIATVTRGGGFAQASLFAQTGTTRVRGFAALSLLVMSNDRDALAGTLDVGFAVPGL